MSWANRYIGIPELEFGRAIEGCDCWGLACLVYARELNITLPSFAGQYAGVEEHEEISALIGREQSRAIWRLNPAGEVAPFDILIFRRGPWHSHVGIAVTETLMLHMQGQARIEHFNSGEWQPRLTGVYSHVKAPVEGAL